MNTHAHHHSHHHHHGHAHDGEGRAFTLGIGLNALFIIAEIMYGLRANSLALLSDAGHNAGDVLGLCMAWGATLLARAEPSPRFTYGLQSSSIIAALANAVLLLVITGGLCWEALLRLSHPEAVNEPMVMIVAAAGVVINGFTAWLFAGGKHDLNRRAAFLHMAADAMVALGVVLSGLVMLKTGWLWLDPLVSVVIGAIIVAGTWRLLKGAAQLALHAVPEHIDAQGVKAYLHARQGVAQVHDLHIWAMSTTQTALSAHLLMPSGHPGDAFICAIVDDLHAQFNIRHATIQIELGDAPGECALAPDTVV